MRKIILLVRIVGTLKRTVSQPIVVLLPLITLIMAPILTVMYIRLARKEEKEMILQFSKEYEKYKNSVPAFFPSPKTILTDTINSLIKEKITLKN